MIWSLAGKLVAVSGNTAVVETGGLGFQVFLPASAGNCLPQTGTQVVLYTSLQVKEDSLTLFGFTTTEQRDFFNLLVSVTGIGPRGALSIVDSISGEHFFRAVIKEDLAALMGLPGVGKKTASRLIVELKDKIEKTIFNGKTLDNVPERKTVQEEAMEGLVSLGYDPDEVAWLIQKLVSDDRHKNSDSSEIIRCVLKSMACREEEQG